MATPRPFLAIQASAAMYRRTWRATMLTTALAPVLFLAAMGLGLGDLVDARPASAAALGGVDYLAFLAPGLLATSAMQTAATESMFPVMAGIRWRRSYYAMLATPLTVADVAIGTVLWATLRVVMTVVIFVAVMALFGATSSTVGVLLAVPAAVLTGAAFVAPLAGLTASVKNEYGISTILRFGIMPMFLFSGAFFPVSSLPAGMRAVAYATPAWHGVDLCRSLALGDAAVLASLGHVAYLALWAAVGTWFTVQRFERRLVT
jgi:lipooligosaccharide transport system permease protein